MRIVTPTRFWIVAILCTPLMSLLGADVLLAQTTQQERRHLRHILLRSEKDADRIMKEFNEGADFKTLARRNSLDITTKVIGGDLGEHGPDAWDRDFSAAAWAIKEIDGITKCKSQFGWHVIQLLSKRTVEIKAPAKPQVKRIGDATPGDGLTRGGDFNRDITATLEFPKIPYAPDEDIEFEMSLTNTTTGPVTIFHPELWPLGAVIRFQFGKMNIKLAPPSGETPPTGGVFQTLEAGKTVTQKYRLQDYTEELSDWPIIRVIWRGDVLAQRVEESFPSVAQDEVFKATKPRWRFYSTPEQHINILPDYSADDRWFALFYIRSFVWVELKDPGIPGLMEHWFETVRTEYYKRIPLSAVEADQFIGGGVRRRKNARIAEPFELPASFTPGEHRKGTVSLGIDSDDTGASVASHLNFALDEPASLNGKSIPIGDVFKGQPFLQWAADQMADESAEKKVKPQISLVNLYTYDILPDEIKELADMPLEQRQKLDVEVAGPSPTNPQPGRATQVFKKDLPLVSVQTPKGNFTIELFEDHAPNTVANFIALAGDGFYDRLTFHRKSSAKGNRGFIQGGSPDNTSMGGPGYKIKDEINKNLKHRRGYVSLAGVYQKKNSGGSQFFICMDDQPQLDGFYTVFGRVTQGMEVVDKLVEGDKMRKVTITRKRDHDYVFEKIEE